MISYFIGVDPGIKGGIVLYEAEKRQIVAHTSMPVTSSRRKGHHDVDATTLADTLRMWLDLYQVTLVQAYVEQVSGRPGQAGQFQFGVNFGVVVGVLGADGIDYDLVPANKWKANYGLARSPGETDAHWKGRSIEMARKIFPDLDCGRKDGIAEAALIVFYGVHSK